MRHASRETAATDQVDAGVDASATRGHGWFTAAIIVTPLFWRGVLLLERDQTLTKFDLRGVLADIAVAVMLVIALTLLAARSRLAAAIVAVAWCLANITIYEHIAALGTIPNVAHIGNLADPTFLSGSALHLRHPLLALAIGVALVMATMLMRVGSDVRRRLKSQAIVLAGLTAALLVWPIGPHAMIWRQCNAFPAALRTLVSPAHAGADSSHAWQSIPVSEADRAIVEQAFRPDLNGELNIARPQSPPNVLLVMLEGVCGGHVPTLARHHGVDASLQLQAMDDLTRDSLWLPNFVVHQCQTNRGEYSLLAGDYDKLLTGEARMTEIAGAGVFQRKMLPAVLRQHGYYTAYLQAAPLEYMMKDRFMPLAGFEQNWGDVDFPRAYHRSKWGIDDRALFQQCLDEIRRIDHEHDRWFVAIMTAGTHHPFIVPDDFEADGEARERALRYMDRALGEFLVGLKSCGLLDDMLLIVTTDESPGLDDQGAPMQWLSKNWGPMMIRTPIGDRGMVPGLHAQSDVPLSIIDYLGLDGEAEHFIGRSIFRTYPAPRPVFFGHTYEQIVGVFAGDSTLQVLTERFEPFYSAGFEPRAIFRLNAAAAPPDHRGKLVEMARRCARDSNQADGEARVIELLDEHVVEIRGPDLETFTMAGQYIAVDSDCVLVLELDIGVSMAEGNGSNRVMLGHKLQGNRAYTTPFDSHWLGHGDFYAQRVLMRTGGPMQAIKLRQRVERENDGEVELRYHKARFTVIPISNWSGPSLWPGEIRVEE